MRGLGLELGSVEGESTYRTISRPLLLSYGTRDMSDCVRGASQTQVEVDYMLGGSMFIV